MSHYYLALTRQNRPAKQWHCYDRCMGANAILMLSTLWMVMTGYPANWELHFHRRVNLPVGEGQMSRKELCTSSCQNAWKCQHYWFLRLEWDHCSNTVCLDISHVLRNLWHNWSKLVGLVKAWSIPVQHLFRPEKAQYMYIPWNISACSTV